jgi:hypothetical protein
VALSGLDARQIKRIEAVHGGFLYPGSRAAVDNFFQENRVMTLRNKNS